MRLGGAVGIVIGTAAVAAGAAMVGSAVGFVVTVAIGMAVLAGWMKYAKDRPA